MFRNPKTPPVIVATALADLESKPKLTVESPKTQKQKSTALQLFKQTIKLSVTKQMFWLHALFIHQGVS